uniref:Uncharacterized protein n=1 Tax=Chromera velia CCMP2878 TaxID=1169474 RepID=A0A0G4HIQ6_9ALVE|eukprot:Cvel_6976.t1-p1 / transcript=Cvel_6976.t1 / gene=Cvel_6976 / organism=Chromera_velia_CCMP2878 / gene_product=hypothetical protein / transcript_product=hypothetical protein / location=Cvel_scaffold354:46571-47368(-) / protein_length=266 / sequence_SO=supercontig / SO=protein_coding / is_pseudo=false
MRMGTASTGFLIMKALEQSVFSKSFDVFLSGAVYFFSDETTQESFLRWVANYIEGYFFYIGLQYKALAKPVSTEEGEAKSLLDIELPADLKPRLISCLQDAFNIPWRGDETREKVTGKGAGHRDFDRWHPSMVLPEMGASEGKEGKFKQCVGFRVRAVPPDQRYVFSRTRHDITLEVMQKGAVAAASFFGAGGLVGGALKVTDMLIANAEEENLTAAEQKLQIINERAADAREKKWSRSQKEETHVKGSQMARYIRAMSWEGEEIL